MVVSNFFINAYHNTLNQRGWKVRSLFSLEETEIDVLEVEIDVLEVELNIDYFVDICIWLNNQFSLDYDELRTET